MLGGKNLNLFTVNDFIQRYCTELNFSIPKASNLFLNIETSKAKKIKRILEVNSLEQLCGF